MKSKIWFLSLALCILFSCKKSGIHLTKITAKNISTENYESNAKIDSTIAPYKKKIQSDMEEVLCYAPLSLNKSKENLQTTAGNFMADCCFDVANPIFKKKMGQSIDFVIFNYGGIRSIIPQGDVTTENAFQIMPFENELLVTTLSGNKVMELFQFFINKNTAHPLSNNIKLVIAEDEFSVKINGKQFDKTKTYHVLTNDYLYYGGNGMKFFENPEKLTNLNLKVRDAIISYFKKVDTIAAQIDNRVIIQ